MSHFYTQRSTTLFEAASTGEHAEVKRLLQNGADVLERDEFDLTALHYASFNGHLDIINVLIASGSDVHATTTSEHFYCDQWLKNKATSVTVLHLAAYNGHLATVQALIDAGADPFANCKYKNYTNAVEMAGWRMHKDVVDFLVSRGALTFGLSPAQKQLRKAIMDGDTKELKTLMEATGFNVNQRCFRIYDARLGFETDTTKATFCSPVFNRGTALHLAIQSGNPAVLDMILDHPGVVVDIESETDAEQLVKQCRDLASNRDNVPALHFAVRLGETAAVEKLLQAGAKIERIACCWSNRREVESVYAMTPLCLAFASKKLEIARLLLKAGAEPDSHHSQGAAEAQAIEYLYTMLLCMVNMHAIENPLYAAVKAGPVDCVSTLLKAGADPNWFGRIFDEILIDEVASWMPYVSEQDENNEDYQLLCNYVDKLILLLDAGIAIYHRDDDGSYYISQDMVQILDKIVVCPQGHVVIEKMIERSAAMGGSFIEDCEFYLKFTRLGKALVAPVMPEDLDPEFLRCVMVLFKAGYRPASGPWALLTYLAASGGES